VVTDANSEILRNISTIWLFFCFFPFLLSSSLFFSFLFFSFLFFPFLSFLFLQLVVASFPGHAHAQTVDTRPFFLGWVRPGNKARVANAYQTISSRQIPADYTRTCIPLEEGTGKYNLKVRATPALVRLAKGRPAQFKSPGTSSPDLLSWMLRRNACG